MIGSGSPLMGRGQTLVRRGYDRLGETKTPTRLAILGGFTAALVWTISTTVFPYHSVNHDEAVYLQQAAMLLDGTLFLQPPVEDAFRPWFFVESDRGMYPKYSPVPAGMFAVGKLLGGYRIALALIAGGCAVLLQRLVATTFDDRTGYVGALVMIASPLFLVDASVFLPYVPTTFLNLAFAVAYVRADRTGSPRWATLAGVAIGLAFFARPFTAVLFATPFVAHALWTLRTLERSVIVRQGITATMGITGVLAALAYNGIVTGDPLVFPYQAFGPHDGVAFGRRELLGYAIEYTPQLGLRTNAEALWLFATRWIVAGVVGTAITLVGLVVAVRRGLTPLQATIAGILVSVPLGNVYFWGTLNTLGDLSEPGDGLAHFLGPYYHVDLLVPVGAFCAVGLLAIADWSRRRLAEGLSNPGQYRVAVSVLVLLATIAGAGAVVTQAAGPLGDNAAVSDQLEEAYDPFDERSVENALVFLPTPYDDAWLNHPFQAVRNDPGFDGNVVYALQTDQFAVLDGFPDRTAYRYAYHGRWDPRDGDPVTARLQPVRTVEAPTLVTDLSVEAPASGERLLVTLSAGENDTFTSVPLGDGSIEGTIRLHDGTASLSFAGSDESVSLPVADDGRLQLRAAVDTGRATVLTYAIGVDVQHSDDSMRALTPSLEVCRDETLCGGAAAYVPSMFGDDISVNATLRPA